MNESLPDIAAIKAQAKRLKAMLAEAGGVISHGHALELVALHYGYRDWNTLSAVVQRKATLPILVGARVEGQYLSHSFIATVDEVWPVKVGWYRIQLTLDDAVDVATSAHFSAWRKHVRAVIDNAGVTAETTSDGKPHLRIQLPGTLQSMG